MTLRRKGNPETRKFNKGGGRGEKRELADEKQGTNTEEYE